MKKQDVTPRLYLSTSGGKWRVILDGMPLCADQDTVDNPQAIYDKTLAQMHWTDNGKVPVWEGDFGQFRA